MKSAQGMPAQSECDLSKNQPTIILTTTTKIIAPEDCGQWQQFRFWVKLPLQICPITKIRAAIV